MNPNKTYTLSFWGRTSSEDSWKRYETLISPEEASQITNSKDCWKVIEKAMVKSHIKESLGEKGEFSLVQLELCPTAKPLEEVEEEPSKCQNYYERFRKNGVFNG